MVRLESIVTGMRLAGVIGDQSVEVVTTRAYGPNSLEVVWRGPDGLGERIFDRSDEPRLRTLSEGRRFAFDGDGDLFRLASEALRIRLAHLFDPYIADNASRIEPLPHQLTAVYGTMLERQPLRFLLADDPGAGKTIMAGLLIKELFIRGTSEAEREARRSRDALQQSVRSVWVQVLHPGPPDETTDRGGLGTDYAMRSTRLVNRGGAKSITQTVWDKVSGDGTVFDRIGPENLARSLEPIWPADRNHLPIATIRDWVASYVYMPRLRDEATLDGAVQRLVEDATFDYPFASAFDEATGTYSDVVDGTLTVPGRFDNGLLVRRSAIDTQKRTDEKPDDKPATPVPPQVDPDKPKTTPAEKPRPKRFFAHINVDAERAGLEVARIMDGLLVELTREKGSTVRVSVDIRGDAQEAGYPPDVVDTVQANARDLKLDKEQWGFEEE